MTFDLQVNKEPKMVAVNEVPMLVVLTSVCTLCVLIVSTLWTCLKIVSAVRTETQETYTLYPEQEEITDELKQKISEEEEEEEEDNS
ncbi:uncharacterized protein LOC132855545 isoform X2 [Tachysurus vachellii]|uniref:uncharacterized protein LOC132855545 isoform X2 n=1 Tax=Tachysurus vachellii TaxID=175792 RepID=UPI00296AFEA3|nr:uncharacterized protein LOC132855545 isoform X2 [Tachysurus vachellii]